MKSADEYRKTWPNKTDDQIIESLGNEVRDKVETIHGLLHDLNEREYTEEDMLFAFIHGGTKFEENKDANILAKNFKELKELINSLNKQDNENKSK